MTRNVSMALLIIEISLLETSVVGSVLEDSLLLLFIFLTIPQKKP